VIQRFKAHDMRPAKPEVKREIRHVRCNLNHFSILLSKEDAFLQHFKTASFMVLLLHKLALFLLPFFPLAPTFSKPYVHPFYVSVVEVNHNKAAATLEISCKLFAEDAEAVLEQVYKTGVDLGAAAQKTTIDDWLSNYIQKHLSVTIDTKAQPLHYLGFEREAESLYCYFEVSGVPAVKTIDLANSLLYDFTNKQINIMHVMANGARKSYKLDYPQTKAVFNF
jgi:hypothetical protein